MYSSPDQKDLGNHRGGWRAAQMVESSCRCRNYMVKSSSLCAMWSPWQLLKSHLHSFVPLNELKQYDVLFLTLRPFSTGLKLFALPLRSNRWNMATFDALNNSATQLKSLWSSSFTHYISFIFPLFPSEWAADVLDTSPTTSPRSFAKLSAIRPRIHVLTETPMSLYSSAVSIDTWMHSCTPCGILPKAEQADWMGHG